jgi:GNAT superfamily N-acetyltransferase
LAAASQPLLVRGRGRGRPRRVLPDVLDSCPYPEIPVVEIGYIATRKDKQGLGLGKLLLVFAIAKVRKMSKQIGVAGIVLDALTPELLAFYSKLKFKRLPYPQSEHRRMLLTMPDAKATIEASKSA